LALLHKLQRARASLLVSGYGGATMTAIISGAGFPSRPRADRNAFLVMVGFVWIGIVSGFGRDSILHLRAHGLDYPVIVHVHAVVFVGWLVLFTVQLALIRSRRIDLHKRLGLAGAALAAVMVVLGPATALVTDAARYTATHAPPDFLPVQFTNTIGFAGLAGLGLLLRGTPSAHKRLMLLSLFYISAPGFNRFLNHIFAAPLGHTIQGQFFDIFGLSDLLMVALGAYDLATRRRLHPAFVLGVVWSLAWQAIGLAGKLSPAWKAVSLHMIGH
jgi:uncharacterized membrane protein YozB (DUF420 family)